MHEEDDELDEELPENMHEEGNELDEELPQNMHDEGDELDEELPEYSMKNAMSQMQNYLSIA